jgi:hypothetical protein
MAPTTGFIVHVKRCCLHAAKLFSVARVRVILHRSVGIVMGWLQVARLRFESLRGKISLCSTSSRLTPGPTQTPLRWVPVALSLGVKRPGREVDHLPPFSVEAKNCRAVPPLPHISSWHSA